AETNVVWEAGWTSASSVGIPPGVLAWNAVYSWHAYTWDGAVVAGPNWVWFFAPVNSAPPAPGLVQPGDAAVLATTTPVFSAAAVDPDGDALSYDFKVSTDAGLGGNLLESGFGPSGWTVPAGTLQDAVPYYFSAAARDTAGATSGWATPRPFSVNLGLGTRPSAPFDTVGPVSVNLVNGNVVASVSTPSVASVGGPLGVSYAYNSLSARGSGLTGSYYNDLNANRAFDEAPSVVRPDPQLRFDWGLSSPSPAVRADGFLARWSGSLQVPTTGSYYFGATGDDGVRVWVGNLAVVDRWFGQAATPDPVYADAPAHLSAGPVPVTVEYYENTGAASLALWWQPPGAGPSPVPAAALSGAAPALPDGWSLSGDPGGDLAYSHARIGAATAVLVEPNGATHPYSFGPGNAWVAPAEEGTALANDAGPGLLVAKAPDGRSYGFNADGTLASVTSALDPARPAAPRYTWSGTPSRLTSITDPVSGRAITLDYGSPCPTGLLCRVGPAAELL
ncbi:MAG: PA14 domain-containing protein, partial [Acidimicrobiales bacterium]